MQKLHNYWQPTAPCALNNREIKSHNKIFFKRSGHGEFCDNRYKLQIGYNY